MEGPKVHIFDWDKIRGQAIRAALSAAASGADEEGVAGAFLRVVQGALTDYRVPDEWTLGGVPLVGVPKYVAVKYLDEPVPSSWGGEIGVHCVGVAPAVEEIVDAAKGEVLVGDPEEFGRQYLEEHPQGVRFCVASRADHEAAQELIEKYLVTDLEDFKGCCLVQAMYPVGLREVGDPEWDEMVRRVRAADERRRQERRRRYEEERRREGEQRRALEAAAEEKRRQHYVAIRRGEKPALWVGDQPIFMPKGIRDTWHLDVPDWAVGQLVGYGGCRIRHFEENIGVRVRLHGYPEEAPRGANAWWNTV